LLSAKKFPRVLKLNGAWTCQSPGMDNVSLGAMCADMDS
jgi:hypothetical protein